MRNLSQTLSIILLIFLFACNSSTQSGNTETIQPDTATTAVIATDTIKTNAQDLDTATGKKIITIVQQKLRNKYKDEISKNVLDSASRRFTFSEYDLNDDNSKEIFVGFTGTYFCGSGGCSFMIINNSGEEVSNFTVSDFPVVLDSNKTNGWKNLIVKSKGRYHLLQFNGKKYPPNPSTAPIYAATPAEELPKALNVAQASNAWIQF